MPSESDVPVLERTIQLSDNTKKARSHLLWGCLNSVVFSILLLDIIYTCPQYGQYTQLIEYVTAGLFLLNSVFHFGRYIWTTFKIEPLALSPRQKILLGVKENDPYVKLKSVLSPTPKKSPNAPREAITPLNMTALSWMSNSVLSRSAGSGLNDTTVSSQNYSVSSSSWMYQAASPGNMSLSPDLSRDALLHHQTKTTPNRLYTSQLPSTPSSGFIGDEDSLSQYLRDFESHEKSSVHGMDKSEKFPSFIMCS